MNLVFVGIRPVSAHLVREAWRWSEATGDPLHLLHVLEMSVPVMGGQQVRDEMITLAQQEKHVQLEQMVHEALGDHAPVPIHITDQRILQDLPDQDGPVRLIFMGGDPKSGIEHLFLGSRIIDLLDRSSLPVVLAAPGIPLPVPAKAIVGVHPDFPVREDQLKSLLDVVHKVISQVELLAVLRAADDPIEVEKYLHRISGLVASWIGRTPEYSAVRSDDVMGRLIERTSADPQNILVLQRRQGSGFDRLFSKSTVDRAVLRSSVPMILLP